MTIGDDELEALLRAANQARGHEQMRLRSSDIVIRERIIRGQYASRTPRRSIRWEAAVALATASVAVVAVVAVNVFVMPQRAFALTPPPLQYGNAESLAVVVADAHDDLAEPGGPQQESRVHSLMWAWNIDIAEEHVEVVPQDVTYEWSLDSGSVSTVVAGESYWDQNSRPQELADSPYKPGELISEITTPAAQFTIPASVAEVGGSTRGDLDLALEALGAPADASSGQLLAAVGLLMSYWTLSDGQHATLIDMLVDAGGVTVLGETVDRAGRPVVGLRVSDSSSPYQDTLLISEETGRIVGMENELTEPMDFIPAGVVGYTLWDVG